MIRGTGVGKGWGFEGGGGASRRDRKDVPSSCLSSTLFAHFTLAAAVQSRCETHVTAPLSYFFLSL